MNRLSLERFGKPWLANDIIFSLTPTGREQKKLLKILHGFTEEVGNLLKGQCGSKLYVQSILLFFFLFVLIIDKRKELLLKEKSAKLMENGGETCPEGNQSKAFLRFKD